MASPRRKAPSAFYSSFIERAPDPASHLVVNESKGCIAKDTSFLRNLELLLRDPDSSCG